MSDNPLIKPTPFVIADGNGEEKTYILSNFDAIAGREIIALYPTSGLPKIGDYALSEKTMIKLMGYVAVPMPNGDPLRLSTEALIKNHVADWETLAKIEMAMMEKNCSFFRDGRSWDFLENLTKIFLARISEMLTHSSVPSSTPDLPPSTS